MTPVWDLYILPPSSYWYGWTFHLSTPEKIFPPHGYFLRGTHKNDSYCLPWLLSSSLRKRLIYWYLDSKLPFVYYHVHTPLPPLSSVTSSIHRVPPPPSHPFQDSRPPSRTRTMVFVESPFLGLRLRPPGSGLGPPEQLDRRNTDPVTPPTLRSCPSMS